MSALTGPWVRAKIRVQVFASACALLVVTAGLAAAAVATLVSRDGRPDFQSLTLFGLSAMAGFIAAPGTRRLLLLRRVTRGAAVVALPIAQASPLSATVPTYRVFDGTSSFEWRIASLLEGLPLLVGPQRDHVVALRPANARALPLTGAGSPLRFEPGELTRVIHAAEAQAGRSPVPECGITPRPVTVRIRGLSFWSWSIAFPLAFVVGITGFMTLQRGHYPAVSWTLCAAASISIAGALRAESKRARRVEVTEAGLAWTTWTGRGELMWSGVEYVGLTATTRVSRSEVIGGAALGALGGPLGGAIGAAVATSLAGQHGGPRLPGDNVDHMLRSLGCGGGGLGPCVRVAARAGAGGIVLGEGLSLLDAKRIVALALRAGVLVV